MSSIEISLVNSDSSHTSALPDCFHTYWMVLEFCTKTIYQERVTSDLLSYFFWLPVTTPLPLLVPTIFIAFSSTFYRKLLSIFSSYQEFSNIDEGILEFNLHSHPIRGFCLLFHRDSSFFFYAKNDSDAYCE